MTHTEKIQPSGPVERRDGSEIVPHVAGANSLDAANSRSPCEPTYMGQAGGSSTIDFSMVTQTQVFLVQALTFHMQLTAENPSARPCGCSRGMMATVTVGLRRMTNTQRIVSNSLLHDESVHFDLECSMLQTTSGIPVRAK